MLDPRDQALQRSMPCQIVPRFGPLPAFDGGMRLLVARSGLYMQVHLDWLDATVCIRRLPSRPPLPYGDVDESIRFAFGRIPVALLNAFIEAGRAALPDEIAGALIYCRHSRHLRLALHEPINASPHEVHYRLPRLRPSESLAVDLHTHGRGAAYWSDKDDRDDQGIKVAGVFGDLHAHQNGQTDERPSAAFRLVINGHFTRLSHPWERTAGTGHATESNGDALADRSPCPTLDSIGFVTVESGPWTTASTPYC